MALTVLEVIALHPKKLKCTIYRVEDEVGVG